MPAAPSLILSWYARHCGVAPGRLPAGAELLVLFAAAAEIDGASAQSGPSSIVRKDPALRSSQRHLAENRKHAHFKCDNRTAV
jgi:hypothetical protein